MIESHLIETFVEVVRCGSVTAAAKSLSRSQPAVSHRIKQLEESFGLPLFARVGRELQLTEAGSRLYAEAIDILERLRALPLTVAGPDAVSGRVRIGTSMSLAPHLLSASIERLLIDHPGITPVLFTGSPHELRGLLQAGELDIAVTVDDADDVDAEAVGDLRLVLAAAQAAGPRGPVTRKYLRQQRYLCWNDTSDRMAERIRVWAEEEGLMTEATPKIADIGMLTSLARSGAGYIVIPELFLRSETAGERLTALPVPGLPESFSLRLAVRQGLQANAAVAQTLELLRDGLRALTAVSS